MREGGIFSRLAVPFKGGCGGFEESFTSRFAYLMSATALDLGSEGLTNISVVLSTMLAGLVALFGAVAGLALVPEFGDTTSLESRKGLVEIGLMMLLSETMLRKGFLDAREVGPRSMLRTSVTMLAQTAAAQSGLKASVR